MSEAELTTIAGDQEKLAAMMAEFESDPAFAQEALPPGESPINRTPICKINGINEQRASYVIDVEDAEWEARSIDELVVLNVKWVRRFYANEYTGDKVAPTCQSPDGFAGYATAPNMQAYGLSRSCDSCSRNAQVYGYPADSRTRMCTSRAHVYAYIPAYEEVQGEDGDGVVMFDFPATSRTAISRFLEELNATMGLHSWRVAARFGLEQYKSQRGKHWRVQPSVLRVLESTEQLAIAEKMRSIKSALIARPNMASIEAESDLNAPFEPAIAATAMAVDHGLAQPARPKPIAEDDDDDLGFS